VSNWFLGDLMSDAAAETGASLFMDGEDGDGLLSGNPGFLSDLIARGRWLRWRSEAAAIARIWGIPPRRTLHRALAPLLPPPARRAWWARSSVASYIHPLLAQSAGLGRPLRGEMAWRPGREFATADSTFRDDEGLMALAFDTTPWYVERGITVVRPLLDRDLIEYCGSLPWDQKVRGGVSKVILRRAMQSRLPESLLSRTDKANLSSVFRNAVTGPQRKWVLSGIESAHAYTADIFSIGGLDELRVKFEQGADVVTPSRVALLAHWLRWLESASPRSFTGRT
jgi:asparagine synthase (glutamine-hydrolysing)